MKILIFILLFILHGWSLRSEFNENSFDQEKIKFMKEESEANSFDILFNFFIDEELKRINITKEKFEKMQKQLEFWRMMKENYNSQVTYFRNS